MKEFYLGLSAARRKSFRDVEALSPPQALAGLNGILRYAAKTRDPELRAGAARG